MMRGAAHAFKQMREMPCVWCQQANIRFQTHVPCCPMCGWEDIRRYVPGDPTPCGLCKGVDIVDDTDRALLDNDSYARVGRVDNVWVLELWEPRSLDVEEFKVLQDMCWIEQTFLQCCESCKAAPLPQSWRDFYIQQTWVQETRG